MDLSIVIPAFERTQHLKATINRLEVNAVRHPEIEFETIIINGNSEEHLITAYLNHKINNTQLKMKHLFCNFGKWVNPSLPRNIAFKYATGDIYTMIDIDHYVGEDFILGAIQPWIDDDIAAPILNYGFMIDTNEARRAPTNAINKVLLNVEHSGKIELIKFCNNVGIPVSKPVSPWLLSYPAWAFNGIGGYDEDLTGWGREDDMFYLMLKAVGLHEIKDCYKTFCGLHLNHSKGGINGIRDVRQNHGVFMAKKNNLSFAIKINKDKKLGVVPSNIKFWEKSNY